MSQISQTVPSTKEKGKGWVSDLHRAGVDVVKNDQITDLVDAVEAFTSIVDNVEITYNPQTRQTTYKETHYPISTRITFLNRAVHACAKLGEASEDRRFARMLICWEKLMKHWRWYKSSFEFETQFDDDWRLEIRLKQLMSCLRTLEALAQSRPNILLNYADLMVSASKQISRFGVGRFRGTEERMTEYGELVIIPWGMMIKNFVFKEKHFVPQHANVIVQPTSGNRDYAGYEDPVISAARAEAKAAQT